LGEITSKSETAPFTIEQFYKFIGEGKLMAAKCMRCGSKFIPPRQICTNCYSKDLTWVQPKNKGKLLTYTIIYVAPEQFQSIAPYAYGIIELEDGLRLPGIIKGVSHEMIRIGMELEVDFETTASTNWPQWTRYFFRPA